MLEKGNNVVELIRTAVVKLQGRHVIKTILDEGNLVKYL